MEMILKTDPKVDEAFNNYPDTSRLVETFKLVFGELFEYEKNRAIIFQLDKEIPVAELNKCIKATLIYHKVKNDITLGI